MSSDLLAGFGRCRQAAECDEAHVAALVARLLDSRLDTEGLMADLGVLAEACPAAVEPWRYLESQGFRGNAADYDSLDNSNLAWVLANRRGIPITLAVVLIRVARASGRRAVGINFPGNFLVEVDDVLVDPFVMSTVLPDELVKRLPPDSRLPRSTLFAPASPVAVGLRMLNNVSMAFTRDARWHRVLDVLDAQLALAPEQPALLLEKGDVWGRLGSVAAARECWAEALNTAESLGSAEGQAMAGAVRARQSQLGGADDDVVH